MDARLHYSRRLLLPQLQGPAACPSPVAAAPIAVVPAAAAGGELNSDEILTIALLTCGLVAALAFRTVLQCALCVTRGACPGGGAAGARDDDDDDPKEEEEEHEGGGADPAAAAARHGNGNGRKQQHPRRLPLPALPCLAFSAGLELELAGSECAICLAEFARGEAVRVLPRCNHGFHARCIDRWLAARPTCPTCRQAPFAEPTMVLLL